MEQMKEHEILRVVGFRIHNGERKGVAGLVYTTSTQPLMQPQWAIKRQAKVCGWISGGGLKESTE